VPSQRHLDEAGVGQRGGQLGALLHRDDLVAAAVHHQRGDGHVGRSGHRLEAISHEQAHGQKGVLPGADPPSRREGALDHHRDRSLPGGEPAEPLGEAHGHPAPEALSEDDDLACVVAAQRLSPGHHGVVDEGAFGWGAAAARVAPVVHVEHGKSRRGSSATMAASTNP